jgi:hypothetical protein
MQSNKKHVQKSWLPFYTCYCLLTQSKCLLTSACRLYRKLQYWPLSEMVMLITYQPPRLPRRVTVLLKTLKYSALLQRLNQLAACCKLLTAIIENRVIGHTPRRTLFSSVDHGKHRLVKRSTSFGSFGDFCQLLGYVASNGWKIRE